MNFNSKSFKTDKTKEIYFSFQYKNLEGIKMDQKGIRETITFSCEPKFKKLISVKFKELGYKNKSQMIRDALQSFFESEKVIDSFSDTSELTVIISVVYDHHDGKTVQQYIEAQHKSNVNYSSHFHMNKEECLEIVIIRDRINNIRMLLKELRSIEGLKNVSLRVVSTL